MDKTAVVILNWNGRSMLEKYIPTVVGNSDGAVIYVADNASTDDSLDMLSEKFPQVRQIVLDKNYGFADGYNKDTKFDPSNIISSISSIILSA